MSNSDSSDYDKEMENDDSLNFGAQGVRNTVGPK
jgi:hypothetical protein